MTDFKLYFSITDSKTLRSFVSLDSFPDSIKSFSSVCSCFLNCLVLSVNIEYKEFYIHLTYFLGLSVIFIFFEPLPTMLLTLELSTILLLLTLVVTIRSVDVVIVFGTVVTWQVVTSESVVASDSETF